MNRPKRHHYLPQFYLEGFTRDGLLWVYDRKTKTTRKQTPVNTAVESDFYTYVDLKGNESAEIEKLFARLEGYTKPVIDLLTNRQEVSVEQRGLVAGFIGTLYIRTPGFRRMSDGMREQMMRRVMRLSLPDVDTAATRLPQMRTGGPNVEGWTPAQALEVAQNPDDYGIDFPLNVSLHTMLTLLPQLAPLLWDLKWTIMHAPQNKSFVTSDVPFLLFSPSGHKPGFPGVGLMTPGAVKVVPLNQRACLVMGDLSPGSPIKHVDAESEWVRNVNLTATKNCERFVIGPVSTLVASLVRATAVDRTDPPKRFQVG